MATTKASSYGTGTSYIRMMDMSYDGTKIYMGRHFADFAVVTLTLSAPYSNSVTASSTTGTLIAGSNNYGFSVFNNDSNFYTDDLSVPTLKIYNLSQAGNFSSTVTLVSSRSEAMLWCIQTQLKGQLFYCLNQTAPAKILVFNFTNVLNLSTYTNIYNITGLANAIVFDFVVNDDYFYVMNGSEGSNAQDTDVLQYTYPEMPSTSTTQGINTNVANISNTSLAVGQNWTLQCSAYNANGASAALNSSVTTILSSSSCTCPASPANWTIQLADNCNITNSCNIVGYYLIYNGTGTVTYNNSSATIKISAKGEKLTNIVAPFYEKILTMLWKNYIG
jgi:hypothetical protein